MRQTPSSFQVLRNIDFRRIWTTSIFAHFGNWVLTVTAAWSMTTMTDDPTMIALVQTAIFIPYLLFGLIAGTLADIFDRRLIIISSLSFRMLLATLLAVLSTLGALSPFGLLSLCFLFGIGGIAFAPAWQTSISEQVLPGEISHAIALNSISFNIARSIGPALGGIIVAAMGTLVAFFTTVISNIPVLIAVFLWKPIRSKITAPRERFWDGVGACIRYITHTPSLKNTLIRGFVLGVSGGIFAAFAPMVAKESLAGGAGVYGLLLTGLGAGAIIGALLVTKLQSTIKPENILGLAAIGCAGASAIIAVSSSLVVNLSAFFIAGTCFTASVALINISVQVCTPNWVNARALSAFQSLIAGGAALGASLWGSTASQFSLATAFFMASFLFLLSTLLRFTNPVADIPSRPMETPKDITYKYPNDFLPLETGPIIVEIHYHVSQAVELPFLSLMKKMKAVRLRNGARSWTLSHDVEESSRWIQSYIFPTWRDLLHFRSRRSKDEITLIEEIQELLEGCGSPDIHVRLRTDLSTPFS